MQIDGNYVFLPGKYERTDYVGDNEARKADARAALQKLDETEEQNITPRLGTAAQKHNSDVLFVVQVSR